MVSQEMSEKNVCANYVLVLKVLEVTYVCTDMYVFLLNTYIFIIWFSYKTIQANN